MVRRLALALVLILAAAPAGATDSRITALGEGSSFYEDDRGVMRWYGSLPDYPDLLSIESGHFTTDDGYKGSNDQRMSGPAAGAHLQIDEKGVWGTGAIYWHGRGDDADPGSLGRAYLGDVLTFMWGKKLETVTIGLVWREGGETWTPLTDQATSLQEASLVRGRQEIGFGLRFDLAGNAYLDVSGESRRYTRRGEGIDTDGSRVKTPGHDSWDNYGFRARTFWQISQRLVLVPLLEYVGEDNPGTELSEDDAVTQAGHLWRMGCGLNFLRDTDNLVVLSADYIDGRNGISVDDTDLAEVIDHNQRYTAFLGRVALESRLAYWITGRFAVGYENLDHSGDFPNPESGSTLLISGGAGIQLGDYVLDLALAGREPRGFSRYAPTLDEVESKLWMSATFRWDF